MSSSSESDFEMESIFLLYSINKNRRRTIWQSEYMKKRTTHGEFVYVMRELSDTQFKNYFRLDRIQYKEVHDLIQSEIYKEGIRCRKAIGTEEKLAMFLRYLASGNSYKSLAYSCRMNDRTVSSIVKEVSRAIYKVMQPLFLAEPTKETWKNIAVGYERKWHFPHCVGAIDGRHVVIIKPAKSGSSFRNYKRTFSIILMATVDANYKFTTIDVGSMGRFSDGNVFANCNLAKKIRNKTIDLPTPDTIIGQNETLPYIFVGDEAFPLMENLMRPFPKPQVTNNMENKMFNYRLSRARRTVECTFGIMANRFRVFRKPFEINVNTVDYVVKAACVLHNYLRERCCQPEQDLNEVIKPTHQLINLQQTRNRSTNFAFHVRNSFKQYFNSKLWAVPWQTQSVQRGQY